LLLEMASLERACMQDIHKAQDEEWKMIAHTGLLEYTSLS
jgi:hypothetical protein